MLNAVYEVDFRGFSYGFRPGREPHDALDALAVGITRKKVNWVLDADIRDFFNQLDHSWLRKFLEHRIADKRVLRLIGKWLTAGVIEDGEWTECDEGSPQGASVSPLLANVYLHYVFDLWADYWRRTRAHGDVIIVRFADDFIVGFEHEQDARAVPERPSREVRGLRAAVAPGQDATDRVRAVRHPESGSAGTGQAGDVRLLGLHAHLREVQDGTVLAQRVTISKRMRAKLREVNDQLKRRRHQPVSEQGAWLRSVVQGHFAYYAVPGNTDAMKAFRDQVTRHWYKALRRRSQRARLTWTRMHVGSRNDGYHLPA